MAELRGTSDARVYMKLLIAAEMDETNISRYGGICPRRSENSSSFTRAYTNVENVPISRIRQNGGQRDLLDRVPDERFVSRPVIIST